MHEGVQCPSVECLLNCCIPTGRVFSDIQTVKLRFMYSLELNYAIYFGNAEFVYQSRGN